MLHQNECGSCLTESGNFFAIFSPVNNIVSRISSPVSVIVTSSTHDRLKYYQLYEISIDIMQKCLDFIISYL